MGGSRKIIILGVIVAVALGAYVFLQNKANTMAKQQFDRVINEQASPFVKVNYKKIRTNLLTGKVIVSDLDVVPTGAPEQSPVLIQALSFNGDKNATDELTALAIDANGVKLPVDTVGMSPASQAFFAGLKEKTITTDVHLAYNYNEKDKSMQLDYTQNLEGLGQLKFDAAFTDFNPKMETIMQYNDVKLKSMDLAYVDHSLVPRILDVAAKQAGVTKQAYVAKLLQGLEQSTADGQPQPESIQKILAQWRLFLQDPKQFEIKMAPKNPIAIGQLQQLSPNETVERLNITATAGK